MLGNIQNHQLTSPASWGGLFFLSLYLAGKLHLFDNRGEVWKVFVVMIPSLGAGLIAVSRIEDARHHPFDVITGSLLGVLCAYVSYRQYFPSLAESWKKGRAHPNRSWGTGPVQPDEAQAQREFVRDKGQEPLRSTPLSETELGHEHETQYDPPNLTAPNEGGLNVFREQVAANERLRDTGFLDGAGLDRSNDRGNLVRHVRSGSDTPLAVGRLRSQRGTDEYWDGTSDEGAHESIELQPRHELPAPHLGRSAPYTAYATGEV